jgi:hypothetical protein
MELTMVHKAIRTLTVVSPFVCLALLLQAASATVSAQDRSPRHPLNLPSTDAEIIAALGGTDQDVKQLTIKRASQLPPNALRPATVKAVSDELIKIVRQGQARFAKEPFNATEETSDFEYKVALAEVLIGQKNPVGIDGLAAVANMGEPGRAMVHFGEAAVRALVRVAGTEPEEDPGQAAAAMDALAQMLESQTIRPTLSTQSHLAIRQVAGRKLGDIRGNDNWRALASAAGLAVATGDVQLRKQVEGLVDNNAEFVRRGMDLEWQQQVSGYARRALEKFQAVP